MPVRRIVCCKSCRKRFASSSGSTLCLSCRPNEAPPKLKYGGNSLSVPPPSSKRREVKICTDSERGTANEQMPSGSGASTVESSSQLQNNVHEKSLPQNDQLGGDESKRSKPTFSPGKSSSQIHPRIENRKRKPYASFSAETIDIENGNNPHPFDYDDHHEMAKATAVATVVEQQHSSKKQKVESKNDQLHPDNSEHNALDDVEEVPHSTGGENIRSIARLPKVSIGSTSNDGCNSESDDDEMDVMIAQEYIWSARNKCEAASNATDHIDTETNPQKEGEDDDSDIQCLGEHSEHQPNKSDFQDRDDEGLEDVDDEEGSCATKGPNFSDDDETDRVDLDDTQHHRAQPSSPNKDVCYLCGSDLTRLKGLRGRVAHMKRCSAKYGNVVGDRRVMNTDGGDFDADFVGVKEEVTANEASKAATTPNHASGVINPYKSQWHGDASSELELNKPMSPTSTQQPKQTMLKQFFKVPVRSLTNVLMAGARQAAKGKAIATSKGDAKSGKQSYKKSHWGYNNNRRNGTCPSYKRIPGTDFICDGFHYATDKLSGKYFLTHFHSDHYGGITKTWSAGAIYCSLPTANLVHQQLGVEKRYLHPLPMNTPTVIASRDKPITVTLLNANHCPGAIMFLFEVGNKRILHVGDFRWNRQLMMEMPQLRAFSKSSPRLDEIFLDTTYCNKKYSLPTQEEAINAAIEVAEKEMATSKKDQKNKTLFLFGSYTIGKEKIYLSVAEHFGMKVYVDSRRYRILSALEWPERMRIFTTQKSETNIWVVPLSSVNFKQMRDYLDEGNKNKVFTAPYGRVVGFRPTGWTYSAQDKNQRTLPCGRPKPGRNLISSRTSGRYSVHGVPYSEHSSFPELVDCLRCLKPKKITPTVSVSKGDEQVELLLNEL